MTVIGWINIAVFCAVVVALVKPLGYFMTRVFNGERTFLTPVFRPVETALYRIAGIDERREQHWLTYTVAMLLFHIGGFILLYALLRLQGLLPFNPQDMSAVPPDLVLQHGRQLRHQHQLAELRRRKHDVLSRADAGPHASELPVGGDRHRAGRGADSRLFTRLRAGDRQLLGRSHPLHALHPAADLHRLRAVPGMAGHAADAGTLRRSDDARRRQADHCRRPGRLAGGDQDARHQRRRLLQRQRRASLREPDAAVELHSDDLDLRHRRGADQCVRPHGRRPASGLGHSRCHGRAVRRWRGHHLLGRGLRHHGPQCARPHRRQHGRQGGALRHRRLGPVRGRHHRCLLRRRQRHA